MCLKYNELSSLKTNIKNILYSLYNILIYNFVIYKILIYVCKNLNL